MNLDKNFATRLFHKAVLILLLGLCCISNTVLAASSAVVLMYHRFGENEHPSTNIRLEQFEAHIAELTSGAYTVLPVSEIVKKLKAGEPLPDRTVGITVDDAYRSTYHEAWPRLRAAGLPFTVFVSTAHVDHGAERHLSWDLIREMRDNGVDFGHHTVSHLHMPVATEDAVQAEILLANKRFKKELGATPELFAYPYGEASLTNQIAIKQAGFMAAFGQHSGAIDGKGDMHYLPRFSLNEKFGGEDRFRLLLNAVSIPSQDFTPNDPLITSDNPPAIGFTVLQEPGSSLNNLERLSCFLSHEGQRADIDVLGPRVEIRARKPFPVGRTRLNCTMPAQNGRWHWFGHQFVRP